MTRARTGIPGFWFAQAFVTLTLAFLACRMAVPATRVPVDSPPRARLKTPSPQGPASPAGRYGAAPSGQAGGDSSRPPAPLEPKAAPEPVRVSPATPYAADQYRSELIRNEDSYQVWSLDGSELAWLLAHRREALTSDLSTRPETTGGLRVLQIREGSFGSMRGLRVGDILKDINGQSLDGGGDLEELIVDPAYSRSKGWRFLLERDGKALTIDYRPAPDALTRRREH
jgi:hypothetical protein